MTNRIQSHLDALDSDALAPLVQALLAEQLLVIKHWQYDSLRGGGGTAFYGVSGLYRFRGTAIDSNQQNHPWSIILKVFDGQLPSANGVPSSWNYWKREILAYQSSLLFDLPNSIRAARCLGLWEHSPTEFWLWMEDVPEADNPWSLDTFGMAARQLGRFNGAFSMRDTFPELPWLSQSQVTEWVPYADDFASRSLNYAGSDIMNQAFLGEDHQRTLNLWRDHERLLARYSKLPMCLCHQDAHRRNLMLNRSSNTLTAIDWAMVGHSAIGAEVGITTGISLLNMDFPAQQAAELDRTVFENYVEGLYVSGWHGDVRQIRLAYTCSVFVICSVTWMIGTLENIHHPTAAQHLVDMIGHPLNDLLANFATVQHFLLGLAEEAYELLE